MDNARSGLHSPSQLSHADRVRVGIRNSIKSGSLRPGALLPESFVTQSYGASRAPAREAIKVLGEEGWLTLCAGETARVSVFTRAEFTEMAVIFRAVVCAACAKIAKDALRGEKIKKCTSIISEVERANHILGDPAPLRESLMRFFSVLIGMSNLPLLARIVELPLHVIGGGLHQFSGLPSGLRQIVTDIYNNEPERKINEACDYVLSRAMNTWRPDTRT